MFNNHMAYHLKTNCDFPSAFADTVASKCIRAVICINTRQIITTKLNEVLQVASQAGEVRVIVGLKVFQEEELSRASELGAGSRLQTIFRTYIYLRDLKSAHYMCHTSIRNVFRNGAYRSPGEVCSHCGNDGTLHSSFSTCVWSHLPQKDAKGRRTKNLKDLIS